MARKFSKGCFNCFRPDCQVEPEGHEMSGVENCDNVSSDAKRRDERKSLRGLRRFVKAVLFDILLVKKIVRKKSKYKLYASKNNTLSAKIKHAPHSANKLLTNDHKTNSNYDSNHSSMKSPSSKISSTTFGSSSGSSVISSTSFGQEEDFEYKQTEKISSRNMLMRKSRDLNRGLCLFVVCLLVLTCWGKVCAIFCTSALFVLVPSRVKCIKSIGQGQVWSREMDLKEHKKRIIMEGLLARTP